MLLGETRDETRMFDLVRSAEGAAHEGRLSPRESRARQAAHRRLVTARLRLLFELCAIYDVEERFRKEYNDQQVEALDTEITPLALRLLPPWARVRAQAARHVLRMELERHGDGPVDPVPPLVAGAKDGAAGSDAWPPPPDTICRLLSKDAVSKSDLNAELKKSHVFIDHYNAACTFAVALLREPAARLRRSDENEHTLAEAAVKELELAVREGGSEKIASRWDWILKEDPDLAGLRADLEFRRFESERFPSSQQSPVRPSEIGKLVAARHDARLCRECATRLEKQWHDRADNATATNPHDALGWWGEERQAWQLARRLSMHHRHWQTRLEVILQMQRFCAAHELGEFAVSQPTYADERIDEDHHLIDSAARKEIQYADHRIRGLNTS